MKNAKLQDMKQAQNELSEQKMEELALQSYEKYFDMEKGSANIKQVMHSKIGVEGFSKMVFEKQLSKAQQKREKACQIRQKAKAKMEYELE